MAWVPPKAPYLVTRAKSHAQKVQSLYKRYIRAIQSRHMDDRLAFRYEAVKARAEFDRYKDLRDMNQIKALMAKAEAHIQAHEHAEPIKFQDSPGGLGYGRSPMQPDMILDGWHPLDKAQYPEYFARRDVAKRKYIEWWDKTYGSEAEKEKPQKSS